MSATRDKLLQFLVYRHNFALEVPFKGLNGKRRFKFDAGKVLPSGRVIGVDYHGWGSGAGHMYREKQAGDHVKQNEAALCGVLYLVCDAPSVDSGLCMEYVELALASTETAGPDEPAGVRGGEGN